MINSFDGSRLIETLVELKFLLGRWGPPISTESLLVWAEDEALEKGFCHVLLFFHKIACLRF